MTDQMEARRAHRGLGDVTRKMMAQTFAAFEALTAHQYAAPWQAPARRRTGR